MLKQRILVVDDDRSIAKILRGYLEQAGYTVFVAYDGQTAVQTLRSEKPDLLVLDLMLPDRDGYDITRFIREDRYLGSMPIIMLTARVDDTDKIIGLELGADDYITKPFNAREVVARVRALLRRAQFDSKPMSILQSGRLKLDANARQISIDSELIELTPTEFNLLYTLMQHPGHTFTREELLVQGMGYAYEGMGRTLDTHIRNLRKKIEEDPSNPQYLQTVYSVGYRFVEDEG